MHKRWKWILLGAFLLLGMAAGVFLVAQRPVTIDDNGQSNPVNTNAMTAGWALHDAGVVLNDIDEVSPGLNQALPWNGAAVQIRRARPVYLLESDSSLVKSWWTVERLPERLLAAAGVSLGSADKLHWNGANVALDSALPEADSYLLQILRPAQVTFRLNGVEKHSSAFSPVLGSVLWDLGLRISLQDILSQPFTAPLAGGLDVVLKPALPFRILADGKEIAGRSAAKTVGEALVESGMALTGLDYTIPAEDQALPADGRVRLVRVREQIELQQTSIPYKSETVADPNTELDQLSVVQAGQPGVKLARVRIRFEDGKEVSRQNEAEWVASQPRNQKTGYGTKVVIHTLDTPDGQIHYWRKVTVYATSFAPCNFIQFIGKCSYTTAAGYPLQKGVIGVGEAWYRIMKGWGVYVDGYGSARVGDYGYVPGYWIDLGYSDADFVNWHRNTTIYFLTPVPANIPWTLPK